MNKHLIYKYRVNATGASFHELKVMGLEDLKNYTSAAEGAKTIRGAISKINKDYADRYASCYRNYARMEDFGAIKKGALTPEVENLSITKYSAQELIEAVAEIDPALARDIEGRV